jgi:hypothetical protein
MSHGLSEVSSGGKSGVIYLLLGWQRRACERAVCGAHVGDCDGEKAADGVVLRRRVSAFESRRERCRLEQDALDV